MALSDQRTYARTFTSYQEFSDPMLVAVAASNPRPDADAIRWLGYVDQELKRLRELVGLATRPGYAQGIPQYDEERIDHGE